MPKVPENHNNFEEIYLSFYPRLKRFAQEYVVNEADAENIIQDIFLVLWEKRDYISPDLNLTSFLFTTVKNKCIDFLRHRIIVKNVVDKMQQEFEQTLHLKLQSLEEFDETFFSRNDLETIIQNAIQSLPEKCRKIFIMNKIEGKKQKDIAQELQISVNTVECQMAIAYQKLKKSLKNYLPILIFFFI
jgi:RNA polymerase sigma-70 factor (ECF subfamily)